MRKSSTKKSLTLVEMIEAEDPISFEEEVKTLDVTEKICELMNVQKVSSKDLAEKMGVRVVDIENMLDGLGLTFGAVVRMFACLGKKIKIELEDFSSTKQEDFSLKNFKKL